MISIKTVNDLVLDILDKNNGKYLTGEEVTRLVNISSQELFDELVGITNKKLDGRTNVVYGKSQNTDRRLNPFRTTVTIPVVSGEALLPSDCGKITSVLISRDMPVALKRIDEDRLGMIYGNPLREPNDEEMYYLEDTEGLQILGALDSVHVKYLKRPSPALYAEKDETITAGSRTVVRKVYDEDNSVDLEWGEGETLDIVNRVLAKVSIPLRDQFLSQQVQVAKINE